MNRYQRGFFLRLLLAVFGLVLALQSYFLRPHIDLVLPSIDSSIIDSPSTQYDSDSSWSNDSDYSNYDTDSGWDVESDSDSSWDSSDGWDDGGDSGSWDTDGGDSGGW